MQFWCPLRLRIVDWVSRWIRTHMLLIFGANLSKTAHNYCVLYGQNNLNKWEVRSIWSKKMECNMKYGVRSEYKVCLGWKKKKKRKKTSVSPLVSLAIWVSVTKVLQQLSSSCSSHDIWVVYHYQVKQISLCRPIVLPMPQDQYKGSEP